MCKFHKTVAREIATNPVNGIFDPARYAVALVALSTFRIEQSMPSMYGCDGYSKYELATDKARIAVANSNMNWHHGTKDADMETLRRAMDIASYKHNLSIKGLNLPKNPVRDTAFLDEATVELYEGYTAPGYAAAPLSLKAQAHKPEFEAMRAAVETFMQNPVTFKALARRFENITLQIFADAHQSAHPALVGVYERIPGSVRNAFKSCAMCVGGGAGGAAVSHVGCIAIPAIAAASGTAVSAGAMAGLMMVTAPVIAVAVTYGIDKWRGTKASAIKLGCSAALAFGIAAGVSWTGGHDNHGGGEHDHHDNHHQMHDNHHQMQNPGLPADEWKKLTDESTMCKSPRP